MTVTIKPRVIDISHYNIIKESLKPAAEFGIWGVIHKATEGTHNQDQKMMARKFLTEQAGLLWGTYHFIRPGNIEAQVHNYLETINLGKADLMVLDWEDNRVSPKAAREWLESVYDKTKKKPVIYSGNTAKELIHGVDTFFGGHKLWLAQYGSNPSIQKSWDKFWLWQFTGDGKGPEPHTVPGIYIQGNPGIDINHYEGTKEQLIKEWTS